LEDLGVDGRVVLRRILRGTEWEDVGWIHLDEDEVRWGALVNTVMNL